MTTNPLSSSGRYLDVPEGKRISSTNLRRLLVDSFDLGELEDLSADLDIDFNRLPLRDLSTHSAARELIKHVRNRNRLQLLVIVVLEQRPHVPPHNLFEDIPTEPDEVIEAGPSLPQRDPSIGNETQMISKGLVTLIKLLRSPEVRTAVVSFQTDFQAASEQIDLLNDYKLLHDYFQQLENRYFLIYNDQQRLPQDDSAWDSIMLNEPEIRSKIDDLLQTVSQAAFAETEARWTRQLENARGELRTAVEDFDLDILKKAIRILSRILNRQPSRINAQLVTTAGSLRLDTLVNALTAVKDKLAQSASSYSGEVVEQIEEGVNALAELDEKLNSLVREHNAWQEIDDELRRIEADLLQGIEELEDSWFELQPMISDLYQDNSESWAASLQKATESLEKAIDDGTIPAVRRHFRRFQSQTRRRFRHVDLTLLELCQEMQNVGEKLDMLLRSFR